MSMVRTCSKSDLRDPTQFKRLKATPFQTHVQDRYTYPYVPETDQDHTPDYQNRLMVSERSERVVHMTDLLTWGPPFIAAERALAEASITPDNEELLRTHHRALAEIEFVWIIKERNGKEIWVILPHFYIDVIDTHVGGLELHIRPAFATPRCILGYFPLWQDDGFCREINPRRILRQEDLNSIRLYHPEAIGIRVYICGYAVFLFKNQHDIEEAWKKGAVVSIGLLFVGYAIADHTATRVEHCSNALSSEPNCPYNTVCLGLPLKLPNGQNVITTATHGFVDLLQPRNRIALCLEDWYIRLKYNLSKFIPIPLDADVPAIGTVRRDGRTVTNTPIGKTVWISGTNRKVGVITKTFDTLEPEKLHFPIGFNHDLSLITDENLPELCSPPIVPNIDGWGEYADVLDGGPIFVTRVNVASGNWRNLCGKGALRETQPAVIAGTEYIWDTQTCSQSISLLWRGNKIEETAVSYSGSVLCLGRPTDKTVKAVLFQNFELLVKAETLPEDCRREIAKMRARNPRIPILPRIKGGFLLPREIRESTIQCISNGEGRKFGTYPKRDQVSSEIDRRSFSSPQ